MILEALHKVANHGTSLSREEAHGVMSEILRGEATQAQIAGLLVGLHMKGETVEEIVGFALAMRDAATPLQNEDGEALDLSGTERDALVDTCGTGGDTSGTFNISTATALLFAPALHSAMKYVQPVRRELHLRTVFNLLGPLTNPARASAQVVGVYSDELVEKLAEALSELGLRRALVVHGRDGLDEITISGPSKIAEVCNGRVHTYEIRPEEFGLQSGALSSIAGGDAQHNAAIIRAVLAGERSSRRDVVVLNAAAALVAAGQADRISEAVPLAAYAIDCGHAQQRLELLVEFTNQPAAASNSD